MTVSYTELQKRGDKLVVAVTEMVAAMASMANNWEISQETLAERYPELKRATDAIEHWKAGVS